MHRLADSIAGDDGIRPLVEYLRPADDPLNALALATINTFVLRFNDPLALSTMTRQMPELEVSAEDLRNLPMPVLNITGERDPLLSDVRDMAALVPNHQSEVIPHADHFNLTSVQKTRETIATFLASVPVDSTPLLMPAS
jgi:pimeloyl-ACP methyl ester carboxylesterase